ncbi:hypothetical protein BDQ12DRAFT_694064 [Crucibulum laeve]|uniref:Uncharacterized protein n=1 Tax=Crucibulum laeve TaxID=68775 RepID=A0A5C3LEE6_9AGAR|nr:hypothetical protein BDQ12DRAFT_694064 [Crucibulum laeve]
MLLNIWGVWIRGMASTCHCALLVAVCVGGAGWVLNVEFIAGCAGPMLRVVEWVC